MKILLIGGAKTENIKNAVKNKYPSGGMEFLVEEKIERVLEVYNQGENFDKAIITEQSWTDDYDRVEEDFIRSRLYLVSKGIAGAMDKGVSYVFLTSTRQMAQVVYEETIDISEDSVILVKEPPYNVSFFVNIIKQSKGEYPRSLVYSPKDSEEDDSSEDTSNSQYMAAASVQPVAPAVNTPPKEYTWENNPSAAVPSPSVTAAPAIIPGTRKSRPAEYGLHNELPGGLSIGDLVASPVEGSAPDTPSAPAAPSTIDAPYAPATPAASERNVPEEYQGMSEYDRIMSIYGGQESGEPEPETEEEGVPFEETEGVPFEESVPSGAEEPSLWDDSEELGAEVFNDEDYSEPGVTEYGSSVPDDASTQKESEQDDIQQLFEDTYGESGTAAPDSEEAVFSPEDYKYNVPMAGVGVGNTSDEFEEPDEEVAGTAPLDGEAIREMKKSLFMISKHGHSIVITGCPGAGTSSISYNLSSRLNRLGYKVCLVDMDIGGRSQAYISKGSYDSVNHDAAGTMAAVNSSSNYGSDLAVLRPGFNMFTTGMLIDWMEPKKVFGNAKLHKFNSYCKSYSNFVIYDVPIDIVIEHASELVNICDSIAIVVDYSSWGVTKTMLRMCNIESDDTAEYMYSKSRMVFNRYAGQTKIMGRKLKGAKAILKAMDNRVVDLTAVEPDYLFADIPIASVIAYDPEVEKSWYGAKAYSDSQYGAAVIDQVIQGLLISL